MVGQYFNHQAAYTAVRILIELPKKIVTGTGFFYLSEVVLNEEHTRSKLLLISNKHVLGDGKGKMILALNRKRDDGAPDHGVIRTFTYDEFANLYFEHPDKNVDLACVDVSRITHSDAAIKHIGGQFLTPIDYERVALGSEVLFVGFPDDYYDTVNNLPLVRKGTLASMPNVDFRGKGDVVIDAQVFQGSSGSPVFVDWDSKYRLLGVLSAMPREGRTPSGYPALLGFGIVIKQGFPRKNPFRGSSSDLAHLSATVCWASIRNRDCIWYPGVGTVVLIRPAQTFYERINKGMCKNSLIMQSRNSRRLGRLPLIRLDCHHDHPPPLPRLQALRRPLAWRRAAALGRCAVGIGITTEIGHQPREQRVTLRLPQPRCH